MDVVHPQFSEQLYNQFIQFYGLESKMPRFHRVRRSSRRRFPTHTSRNTFRQRRMTLYRNPRTFSAHTPHCFKQIVDGSTMTGWSSALSSYGGKASYLQQSVASDSNYACYFALGDCDQSSTFGSLFDQYRFVKVEIRLRPCYDSGVLSGGQATVAPTSQNVVNPLGVIITAFDYDDNTAPTDVILRQYDSARVQAVLNANLIKRMFVPRANRQIVNSTMTAAQEVITGSNPWIDCTTALVPHFGFKVHIDEAATVQLLQNYRVDCTYYLEFKNVR